MKQGGGQSLRRDPRIVLSIDLTLVLMSLGQGLVDRQHSREKWNTQQEHRYPQIIKAPTKPGGVLSRKSPNNKVTHFILILFSPPHPFLHSLLLGTEQWVKSSLERQETCCDSMTHAYLVANTHTHTVLRLLLTTSSWELPMAIWTRQSLLWPAGLSLLACDLYYTLAWVLWYTGQTLSSVCEHLCARLCVKLLRKQSICVKPTQRHTQRKCI